jgi:hypothetical protein
MNKQLAPLPLTNAQRICASFFTKNLLVQVERELEFRKALKIIGDGMPPER